MELEGAIVFDDAAVESPNLCDRFSDKDIVTLGNETWAGYERDKNSRSQWYERTKAAMDLAMQIQQAKTWPWPGCSNVVFPLITIAALQFSARAYPAIIQGTEVVRYRVIGPADQSVYDRATRVGKHMSWQVLEQDEAWEEQHDRMLINLSVVGTNFVKTYFDGTKGYPVSELVMAQDFVLDYYAKSVENCARKTQRFPLYRNQIVERCRSKVFRDITEEAWFKKPPPTPSRDPQVDRRQGMHIAEPDHHTPFYFLEQHVMWDLDKDGYEEPYIITIEESSKCLVRIVARVEGPECVQRDGDQILSIQPTEYYTKYSFIPNPDGSIYDLGFGIFLGPINEAVNSAINQLIDSGTMQTSIGGFLGRGAKIRGGVYTMSPWEWKRVDSTGDDLRKNLVPFPDRQPSEVLFKLVGLLIEYANRIAGTTDPMVGENPGQNTPASTFQGMTEQGMQTYGMIFKRVWRSMKEEFKVRYCINKWAVKKVQRFGSGKDFIRAEDYIGSPDQIVPVANPKVTSTLMRVQLAAAVKQSAMGMPGYDMKEVELGWLQALEVPNIERVYPGPGKVPQGHEAPNPKAMVEQMKLQGKQLTVEAQMKMHVLDLLAQKEESQAKVHLLQAQAMKAASEANATDAALKLETFEKLIQMHQEYSQMVDNRIKALMGKGGEGDDGAGVSGMEGESRDGGDSGVSVKVPSGSNVTVGNGSVPAGK